MENEMCSPSYLRYRFTVNKYLSPTVACKLISNGCMILNCIAWRMPMKPNQLVCFGLFESSELWRQLDENQLNYFFNSLKSLWSNNSMTKKVKLKRKTLMLSKFYSLVLLFPNLCLEWNFWLHRCPSTLPEKGWLCVILTRSFFCYSASTFNSIQTSLTRLMKENFLRWRREKLSETRKLSLKGKRTKDHWTSLQVVQNRFYFFDKNSSALLVHLSLQIILYHHLFYRFIKLQKQSSMDISETILS